MQVVEALPQISHTDPLPLVGENIVCFAKDWNEDPTSNNHLMSELAKTNRVLWLNSIPMRKPNMGSKRDLAKIGRKLREFMKGPAHVQDNLYVYTPISLPFPHSRIAATANRWILKTTIRMLRRKLKMNEFQLWTFLPHVVEYVGHMHESLSVYYCVDEWSEISYLDGKKMAEAERKLCEKADVVFATAHSLVDKRKQFNPETYLALHGVDHKFFASALDSATPIAPEIADLPKPVIGFFGLIHDWIDLDLIGYLARLHPEWSLVMIGDYRVDISSFAALPNVHFLGRRPYASLPSYCKGFSVGLIPFRINNLSPHVNPIKLREYLSAGLPVVSTFLPEVLHYSDHCVVARNYEEFERGIVHCLQADSPSVRQARSDALASETWSQKAAEVGAHVRGIKQNKCQSN